MAIGFGVPGTRPEDLQKVLGGWYNQGVVSGCEVSGSSTLKYTVNPGLAMVWMSGGPKVGEANLVAMPIPSSTVTAAPGPATGTRIDYVYAEVLSSGTIQCGVTQTKPSNPGPRLDIAAFTVPAGMTKTSQAELSDTVNYSTPYGSSGRLLVNKRDTTNALVKSMRDLSGAFSLPTDRYIQVDITVTVDCDVSGGISDGLYSDIYIDGQRQVTFSTGRINESWTETHQYSWNTMLLRGDHVLTLKRREINNSNKIRHRYSSTGFPGSMLVVKDLGVKD